MSERSIGVRLLPMVRVKICGITTLEDALFAVERGVDYVGLILYPKSPRFVPKEKREKILEGLKGVSKVAVMVNPSEEEALGVFGEGFDLIQLHGEEDPELAEKIDFDRVIKAFRVKEEVPQIDEVWRKAHAILLDTYSEKAYGGTGESFNWDIAREIIGKGFRVILSGGLKPENVREAVLKVEPFGVDVSSGVELEPGVKDKMKVERFIKEAKGK